MQQKIVIEETKDGSRTLFIPELNEHYHSVNGAITESKHVFIEAGLNAFLQQGKQSAHILEIGFGTGLNALMTLHETLHHSIPIYYTGLELYPLTEELLQGLEDSYTINSADNDLFRKLHACSWGNYAEINSGFFLKKLNIDFTQLPPFEDKFDVVYFDAFAPEIQPPMWVVEVFDYLYHQMNQGAVLTTYCAKGQVRRNMQQAGFTVERLPGPPGKREMLQAKK